MNESDDKSFQLFRRSTNSVDIGGIPLGSAYPIRVQSMANTCTADITGSVAQCIRIIQAGAEYVRFTVPSMNDVEAVAAIKDELQKQRYATPLIADVHFNADIALKVAEHVDKVRINPGNFNDLDKFISLLEICKKRKVALRIGVNHGSLSERIMNTFGDTPEGMAESAMEFLRICRDHQFDQVVVSMKASNVRVMVQSTRQIVMKMKEEGMYFPLHLGVTEAGEGEDGRIKSAVGIGTLLAEGLGDTIRVSLTEEPEAEIPVARKLVDYIHTFAQSAPFPVYGTPSLGYTAYSRRVSRVVGNVGGDHVPVVIGADVLDNRINLIERTFSELTDAEINNLQSDPHAVLGYTPVHVNVQAELAWLRARLEKAGCDVPVIFKLCLKDQVPEDFIIKASVSLGGAFIDGFGNGIWLTNAYPLEANCVNSTAFSILQACRVRMNKTEYIACPSCGRTNFNLIETLARVKAVTSHLKGLKIGVMGCIVNGPGEMADADYGYVGAGKGKITLYKAREVIKKGIAEENAVEELVALIKEHGDWVEPD